MRKTLVLALCLGAASAYAQNQEQLGNPEFSYQVIGQSSNGVSNVVPCIYQTPDGNYHAAVSVDVPADGTYHLDVWTYYKTLVCDVEPEELSRDVQLPASHLVLYLNVPLPDGYQVSLYWAQIGMYLSDTCVPYQIPTDPDMCM